jgi:hypothetical protein
LQNVGVIAKHLTLVLQGTESPSPEIRANTVRTPRTIQNAILKDRTRSDHGMGSLS